MTTEKVMEPATTEWAALIMFAPSKNDPVYFWVYYRKLNGDTICDSRPFLAWMNESTFWERTQCFEHLTAAWDTGWYISTVSIATRPHSKLTKACTGSSLGGLWMWSCCNREFAPSDARASFQTEIFVILSAVRLLFAMVFWMTLSTVQNHPRTTSERSSGYFNYFRRPGLPLNWRSAKSSPKTGLLGRCYLVWSPGTCEAHYCETIASRY